MNTTEDKPLSEKKQALLAQRKKILEERKERIRKAKEGNSLPVVEEEPESEKQAPEEEAESEKQEESKQEEPSLEQKEENPYLTPISKQEFNLNDLILQYRKRQKQFAPIIQRQELDDEEEPPKKKQKTKDNTWNYSQMVDSVGSTMVKIVGALAVYYISCMGKSYVHSRNSTEGITKNSNLHMDRSSYSTFRSPYYAG